MSFWSNKRVVVTGGAGFLGARLVAKLRELGPAEIFVPRRAQYDLVEQSSVV
jgi:GDP-L-fucose synthase